jgi:arabinose-5-phosphate isomerase
MNNELYNTKNINYIPTNSYMAQTFFCNILINTLINEINITIDDYKKFHPGGNIGQKLLKVKDVLITNFPKIILNNNVTLNSVLLEMTKYNIGCCFFVNNNGDLLGLLTDGDIRRLLIKNTIKNIILQNINTNYKYIDNNMFIKDIKDNNSKFLPVIINKFIGIIDCRA